MFHDKTMLGAGFSASPAPMDALQAFSETGAPGPVEHALRGPCASPEARKGTWFDEGYDFREPAGAEFTEEVVTAIAAVDRRTKKRSEEDHRNHELLVRKVIANAVRCASFHSPGSVAVQRRASAYSGKPTYLNGKAMARTTTLLSDAGLIDLMKGQHNVAATTFVATSRLCALALKTGATEQSLAYQMPCERSVRLRLRDRDTELIAFEPTAETLAWGARLGEVNDFLAQQDIGVMLSAEEARQLTARMNEERSRGKLPYLKPELLRKSLYRQFNNGSFDDGGRMYGGWWINCPRELRQKIRINGSPTVELDFSGCLIRMLYHQAGIDYREDPYRLEPLATCEGANGLPEDHFREPVKRMMQALINGQEGKRNEQIPLPNGLTFRPFFKRLEIVELLSAKHHCLSDRFFTGAGIKLQKIESDITLDVVEGLGRRGIPCLPIHDSFIVPFEHKKILQEEMNATYKEYLGFSPIVA